ncbi:hypothetical protein L6164_017360 [Bauhinia variegata]|uniref:Uncharacterized protein n=1 Tax=Bauhinia variegata TaxID=167791 RepID=A0ACB9N8A1_BAUVA|nr:hypothetical protein L6164_017360 [Bauhinia variegata]
MDPPKSRNEDETVFFDASDDFPFYDCTGDDISEPSGSATTTLCDPESVVGKSQNESSQATSSRCRQIRRRSTGLSSGSSSIGSESDLINDVKTILRQQRRNRIQKNLTENEKGVGKSDPNQAQVSSFPPPNVVREEKNDESAITTAANEAAGDSADSAVEPGDSSSNLLETVAGLVIKEWNWIFNIVILSNVGYCFLMVSSIIMSGFMMKYLAEKPVQMKEILNFDYTKQTPVAYVPIISCAGVSGEEDFDNSIGVSKGTGARVIPPRNKVQVIVSLVVPESEYNRNLGIFQVRVDFLSANGKTIAKWSQPCMLRFRSEPIRLLLTIVKIVPLITGYVSETQTLNVKMRGFIEHSVPASCLKVTLEHRAEYRHGAGIPEIYDASLVFESELPFLKRIVWYWKKTIFIWVTMSVFIVELLFALVCCRPIIIPRTRQRGASTRTPSSQNNLPAQS